MRRLATALTLLALAACVHHSASPDDPLVIAMAGAPTNLDPGIGTDEASQKIGQLVFSSLLKTNDALEVVTDLATRFETHDSQSLPGRDPSGRTASTTNVR